MPNGPRFAKKVPIARNQGGGVGRINASDEFVHSFALFFSKLWKTVEKVASVVVSVVVNVVVGTVTGIVAGLGDGIIMAPFCGVAGAVTGFFQGLESGINCDSFDFACIAENAVYSC